MRARQSAQLTLQMFFALFGGGITGVLLVFYRVPPVIPMAISSVLFVAIIVLYIINDGVRGRHRVFIYEIALFGLGAGALFAPRYIH